jgi:hypothetical protein
MDAREVFVGLMKASSAIDEAQELLVEVVKGRNKENRRNALRALVDLNSAKEMVEEAQKNAVVLVDEERSSIDDMSKM